jgi:hypothetical protein
MGARGDGLRRRPDHLPEMSETVQTRDTPVIQLHPANNVAVAVRWLPAGATVANDVAAREPIPSGHKVAVAPIAAGEAVRRYAAVPRAFRSCGPNSRDQHICGGKSLRVLAPALSHEPESALIDVLRLEE